MRERSVKILLSTYNGEGYLETQLKSLQEQEGVRVSVAVRDDASKDRTCKILERFSGRLPLTLIRGENIGAARSFLQLIHAVEADAEYYAYCDQDDYWKQEKLIKAVERLEKCDSTVPALYYSNVKRVGSALEEIDDPFKKNYHTETFGAVLVSTAAPGCTMVFNKALLLILKEYTPEYLMMHDSWTLQVCAAVGGKVIYDDNSYILYRQHSGNVVGGLEKMTYGWISLMGYRVKKLFDFSNKPYMVAEALLEGYEKKIALENQKIINRLIESKTSVVIRVCLLFDHVIRTDYFLINLKFWLQVILNQI